MPPPHSPADTRRLFHGWVVVGGAFAALFIAFGIAYSFAAFFPSLQREFAATRGETALVFAISGFIWFSVGALSGPLADHLDARKVVGFGMVLIAAGLAAAATAGTLWQVYLAYGVGVGVGVGFVYVPTVGAVQHWFVARRGLASGIAVAGIGCGTLILPLAVAPVIEQWSWRAGYASFAVIALIGGTAAALFLEKDPAKRGLLPDGGAPSPALDAAPPPAPPWDEALGATLRTRPFVFLYVAGFLNSFAVLIPFAHLAAYGADHGIGQARAVLLVGLIGMGSVLGRFAMGGAADRFGRGPSLGLMYLGMGLAMAVWPLLTGFPNLAVFAFAFGVFYGGMVALVPALTADYFQGPRISGIIGALYTCVSIGVLAGPWLAGITFDHLGSYTPAILAGLALNIAAAALIWSLPTPAAWRAELKQVPVGDPPGLC